MAKKIMFETGFLVQVVSRRSKLEECEGIVISTNSDLSPEDGPVAVYLGPGNPNLFDEIANNWKGEIPTEENYRTCPRVKCFQSHHLKHIMEHNIKYQAWELYGPGWQNYSVPPAPFFSGTHECQLKICTSGKLATKKTLIKSDEYAMVVQYFTCEDCHQKFHGTKVPEIMELKFPIPGIPIEEPVIVLGTAA